MSTELQEACAKRLELRRKLDDLDSGPIARRLHAAEIAQVRRELRRVNTLIRNLRKRDLLRLPFDD